MNASTLHSLLLAHADVDENTLNQVYEKLPKKATVSQYRTEIVKAQLLTYSKIMHIFFKYGLSVRANAVIKKVKEQRQKQAHFKPSTHQHKFKISEDDALSPNLMLANNQLNVTIPVPKTERLVFVHSDERQAIELALDIAKQGDVKDAEQILLETLDTFKRSSAAMQSLCWLYLSTAHFEHVQEWAKKDLTIHKNNAFMLETLSLTEQQLGKHFLAASHFQQLLKQARIKPIWYLLVALSQEYGACYQDALENYRIYMTIGKDEKYRAFAEQHLQRLAQL